MTVRVLQYLESVCWFILHVLCVYVNRHAIIIIQFFSFHISFMYVYSTTDLYLEQIDTLWPFKLAQKWLILFIRGYRVLRKRRDTLRYPPPWGQLKSQIAMSHIIEKKNTYTFSEKSNNHKNQ